MTESDYKAASELVGRWARFEDGARVAGVKPDDYSTPQGQKEVDPQDVRAWNIVTDALWSIERSCGLRKCETLRALLHHVHILGKRPRNFFVEGVNVPATPNALKLLGWSAETILETSYVRVLTVVHETYELREKIVQDVA